MRIDRSHGYAEFRHSEGPMVRVNLDCGFPLKALITNQACQNMALRERDEIVARVKAPAVHLIAKD